MEKETIEDRDKRAQELLQASIEVFTNSSSNYKARRGFIEGANWQAERMYSEEDLREAFKQSRQCKIFEKDMPPVHNKFEDWFKQFKKK